MATDASPKFQKPDLLSVPHLQSPPPRWSTTDFTSVSSWSSARPPSWWSTSVFPVDTIKTQMKALGSCPIKSDSVNQAVRSILKSDGTKGFYLGIGAMALGAGPARAV
ncbi:hypothetical protein ABFS83_03G011200 [Erythranthe nasuta]